MHGTWFSFACCFEAFFVVLFIYLFGIYSIAINQCSIVKLMIHALITFFDVTLQSNVKPYINRVILKAKIKKREKNVVRTIIFRSISNQQLMQSKHLHIN